jgi:molecular chaperone DnaJ
VSAGTKDYYATLGVERTATESRDQEGVSPKARECHPDVCNDHDAEERFKSVNEAYDVLSDPTKREMYDRYGYGRPAHGRQGGPGHRRHLRRWFRDGRPLQRLLRRDGRWCVPSRAHPRARHGGPDSRDARGRADGVEREIAVNRLVPCEECGRPARATARARARVPIVVGPGSVAPSVRRSSAPSSLLRPARDALRPGTSSNRRAPSATVRDGCPIATT